MARTDEVILKLRDVSVSYGMVAALKGVSLDVRPGELVALIGSNGAGKSTLLETVLGINRVKSGRVYFQGRDITSQATDKTVASGIALVPEGRGVLGDMSVMENLLLGAYHRRSGAEDALDQVFDLFPILRERREQKAGTLSGGQQQMLVIGRALMSKPKLLLLDEPSLGLAQKVFDSILKAVKDLTGRGYSILLAEQNARKALQESSRAYVFETGKVVMSGASAELINDPGIRRAYLGG